MGGKAMSSKDRETLHLPAELKVMLKGYSKRSIWHSYVADVWKCTELEGNSVYYLKRHKRKSGHDSVKEYEVINWLQGKLSVPSVKCFARDGKYYYLLLTEKPGIPAHRLIRRYRPEEMIRILVPAMRDMHSLPISGCPFDEGLTAKLKRIRHNIKHNYIRKDIYNQKSKRNAVKELAYLQTHTPEQEDLVFTHGDFCLPNFLIENGMVTAYLDLGEAGPCDRYMDISTFAITLCFNYKRYDNFPYYCRLIFEEYGITDPDWSKLHYYHLINEML
jgi:aminoglycoside phosphotransferase